MINYFIKELLVPFFREFYLNNEELRNGLFRAKTLIIVMLVGVSTIVITILSIGYFEKKDQSLLSRYDEVYSQYVELQRQHIEKIREVNTLEIANNDLKLALSDREEELQVCLNESEAMSEEALGDSTERLAIPVPKDTSDPVLDMLRSIK